MKKWKYCKDYKNHKCSCPCSDNYCPNYFKKRFSIKLFIKELFKESE